MIKNGRILVKSHGSNILTNRCVFELNYIGYKCYIPVLVSDFYFTNSLLTIRLQCIVLRTLHAFKAGKWGWWFPSLPFGELRCHHLGWAASWQYPQLCLWWWWWCGWFWCHWAWTTLVFACWGWGGSLHFVWRFGRGPRWLVSRLILWHHITHWWQWVGRCCRGFEISPYGLHYVSNCGTRQGTPQPSPFCQWIPW